MPVPHLLIVTLFQTGAPRVVLTRISGRRLGFGYRVSLMLPAAFPPVAQSTP
jgi:hypothetical protein